MKIHWRFMNKVLVALVGAAVLGACSQSSGTGASVTIPQVVVNCTSTLCRSNSSPVVHVWITKFNCDPNSHEQATTSSSMVLNCTISSGCYGTTSLWVNDRNEYITTITDGSYTVCGRIDYNNNYTARVWTDDTTSINENVLVSSSASGSVSLTVWTDP